MTTDDLKEIARKILPRVKSMLEKHGTFAPYAYLIKPDQSRELIAFPGDAMNDGAAKEAIFAMLGNLARERGAEALAIVTDIWTLDYSEEQKRRLSDDQEWRAEFLRVTGAGGDLDHGTDAAVRADRHAALPARWRGPEAYLVRRAARDRLGRQRLCGRADLLVLRGRGDARMRWYKARGSDWLCGPYSIRDTSSRACAWSYTVYCRGEIIAVRNTLTSAKNAAREQAKHLRAVALAADHAARAVI